VKSSQKQKNAQAIVWLGLGGAGSFGREMPQGIDLLGAISDLWR
jgi:hypothetical protein